MSEVGQITYVASIDSSKFKSDARNIEKQGENIAGSGEKGLAKFGVITGVVAGLAQNVFAKAFDVVGNSVGSAIKRVDTLNNSNRTFANMGFSADATAQAMKALESSITGLPTSLDQAVSGVQLIAGATNDVGKSQKIFSSLNNAILGFGGSSDMVQNSVVQLSQAFSNGRVDGQTWMSMMNSGLGPALSAIARDMGITTDELKKGLSDGTYSVEQFQDALIKMNEQGGGGMQSFQQIAKDATSGIGTGWQNMQTAITRGVAEIIKSIGTERISNAISSIGKAFEDSIKIIKKAVGSLPSEAIVIFAGAIAGLLIPAIIGLSGALFSLAGSIIAVLVPLWPFIAVGAVIAGLALIIKNNWDTIRPVVDRVKEGFSIFWEAIKPIRDFVVNQFKTAWDQLKDSFERMKQSLEPFMPQLKILAIIIGVVLLTPILVIIGVIAALVAGFILITAVIARVIGWFSQLSASVSEVMASFQRSINEKVSNVWNTFRDLPGRIINALGNLGSLLYSAGRDLVQGLINGIKDMTGSAINSVKDVAKSITNGMKSVLGIHSPSKVFANIGRDITAGMTQGIEQGTPDVTKALTGMAQDSTMNIAGSGLPTTAANNTNNNRTVNVSLNMSGIMTRSKTDEREVARNLITRLNEELSAKGQPALGGGAL